MSEKRKKDKEIRKKGLKTENRYFKLWHGFHGFYWMYEGCFL